MSDERVLCQYCGAHNGHPDGVEMKTQNLFIGQGYRYWWFQCPECGSRTPVVKLHCSMHHEAGRIAQKHAIRRFQPMQKPLTLEQVKSHVEKPFARHLYVEYLPIEAFRPINERTDPWRSPDNIKICFGDWTGYNIYFRCWWEEPTVAECTGAAWDVQN